MPNRCGVGLAELGDVVGGLAAGHLGRRAHADRQIIVRPAPAPPGPGVSHRSNMRRSCSTRSPSPIGRRGDSISAEIMPYPNRCRRPRSRRGHRCHAEILGKGRQGRSSAGRLFLAEAVEMHDLGAAGRDITTSALAAPRSARSWRGSSRAARLVRLADQIGQRRRHMLAGQDRWRRQACRIAGRTGRTDRRTP